RRVHVRNARSRGLQVLVADRSCSVTVRQLLADPSAELALDVCAGRGGLSRLLSSAKIQKPGLALTGYREEIHHDRLLSLGGTEIAYLRSITAERRQLAVDTIMAANPACIVVTRGLQPPDELVVACNVRDVPLLMTPLVSADFIVSVKDYLRERLAPTTSLHGVLLDVLGV